MRCRSGASRPYRTADSTMAMAELPPTARQTASRSKSGATTAHSRSSRRTGSGSMANSWRSTVRAHVTIRPRISSVAPGSRRSLASQSRESIWMTKYGLPVLWRCSASMIRSSTPGPACASTSVATSGRARPTSRRISAAGPLSTSVITRNREASGQASRSQPVSTMLRGCPWRRVVSNRSRSREAASAQCTSSSSSTRALRGQREQHFAERVVNPERARRAAGAGAGLRAGSGLRSGQQRGEQRAERRCGGLEGLGPCRRQPHAAPASTASTVGLPPRRNSCSGPSLCPRRCSGDAGRAPS